MWIPPQTIVITLSGQTLPPHVNAFYNSLRVETYILPTIQCNKCCRFGHIKTVCRSSPRCFKCTQSHEGDTCVAQTQTCLHCSESHPANDRKCHKAARQKEIKFVMSQEDISDLEARLHNLKKVNSLYRYLSLNALSFFVQPAISRFNEEK